MSFFTQVGDSELYVAEGQEAGWLGFLLPPGGTGPPDIELDAALHSSSLGGSFVFSAIAPDLANGVTAFVGAVRSVLHYCPSDRAVLWLSDPAAIGDPRRVPVVGLDAQGSTFNTGLSFVIVGSLGFSVASGARLALDGTTVGLSARGGDPVLSFTGGAAPVMDQVSTGEIAFAGPQLGCIVFDTAVRRSSLADPGSLGWGFQFVMPVQGDPVRHAIAEWLPLAFGDRPNAGDRIPFRISIDPGDPFNSWHGDRTVFTFTTPGAGDTTLVSYCVTVSGEPVTLLPVPGPLEQVPDAGRLVISAGVVAAGQGSGFQLAPEGDFVLHVDDAPPGRPYQLMCGLQGTESIAFLPRTQGYDGDRLRFASRQAAYAPRYPFTASSPVDAPVDPAARLLDTTFMTSWATIMRAASSNEGIAYVAQPDGAWLYGRDALIFPQQNSLLGGAPPPVLLPSGGGDAFPLAPYLGARNGDGTTSFSPAQAEDFERQVIAPPRRRAVATGAVAAAPAAEVEGDQQTTVTTPAGLLVTLDGSTVPPAWQKILLGQNVDTAQQMYFCLPDDELRQTFQTNQLLLVVTNPAHLGTLSGDGSGPCGSTAAFYNRVTVGGWGLQAEVGKNSYDDYSNVMIVKGRQGALWDPTSESTRTESLVSNPEKWTQTESFAAPPDGSGAPNLAELTTVSSWLQRYFDDASRQTDTEYFATFNAIARDPNWMGILVLRATIQPPSDLAGISAGITDPANFDAHHFGMAITPVKNDPTEGLVPAGSSSIFGLIYYNDPAYVAPRPSEPVQPVPPRAGAVYDFRVLTLKVLFQNTAVRSFQSYAQITLNRVFGMDVVDGPAGGGASNPYHSIVLRGSYQDNGGQPLYSLSSASDTTFYFDSGVVNKVEITAAQMSVRNPTIPVSWFGLAGFLDFKVVQYGQEPPYQAFDAFSFGNEAGADLLRKGLSFSDLGLEMEGTADPVFSFVTDAIRFDLATSTPRRGSLFQDFALALPALAHGATDDQPSDQGYLTVVTDALLTGVGGGEWYGVTYRLNMGTPGDLAGNVGLASTLLTAWSPGAVARGAAGPYKACVGLALPGTGSGAELFSLENVLKLSIGQLRLTRVPPQRPRTPDDRVFLLLMTEIALKFLGVLKIPPSGSTLFYLFGNPENQGRPSGLGWYAMYAKHPRPAAAAHSASEVTR